jgi:hypothetical protein
MRSAMRVNNTGTPPTPRYGKQKTNSAIIEAPTAKQRQI